MGNRDVELSPHGTKIVVHNLFGNVPVRFKQQATCSAKMIVAERQFEALKQLLVSYLLAAAKPVNLRLHSPGHVRYNHTSLAELAGQQTFSLRNVTSILRQAGLTTHANTWKLASAKAGDVSVRCAISLTPNPSKRTQFISLGQFPIPSRGVASVFYDTVNAMFDASAFGAIEDVADRPVLVPGSKINQGHNISFLRKRLVKGVDRWPAFYIRIGSMSNLHLTDATQNYSADDSLKSTLQESLALLKLLIRQFLQTYSFQPKSIRTRRRILRPTTASRQPLGDSKSFDPWKRLKSASDVLKEEMCIGLPFLDHRFAVDDISLDDGVRPLLKDSDLDPWFVWGDLSKAGTHAISPNALDVEHTLANARNEGDDETTTWTNPHSGKVLHLNARNGSISVAALNSSVVDKNSDASNLSTLTTQWRKLSTQSSTSPELAERPQDWPSSTFPLKNEVPILSLVSSDSQLEDDKSEPEHKIDALQLANAHVLRQVDNKFILASLSCSSNGEESSSLVLIDQHAADERVKVEGFFQQLCSGQCVPLAQPSIFEVSQEEAKRFDQAQPYFASWAVRYHQRHEDELIRDHDQKASIAVTHLPAMIAERCRMEPRILIQMLRKEIWSNEPNRPSSRPHTDKDPWISRVSQCPEGLVQLINSRACRSAIMFNDILTNSQCEEVLRRLSGCSLPFQCAHGRPNITILTIFGYGAGFASQDHERGTFGQAFKRWCI